MLKFWATSTILGSVYLLISLVLFFRSNKQCVISRSPLILQVSHWANFSEIIFTLVIISSSELNLTDSSQLVFWLIESGMQSSHYLMGFCYIVRGYRLYFIFNLGATWEDADSNFFKQRHRASQRWSLLLLVLMISPVFLLCLTIILILAINEDAIHLYVKDEGGLRTNGHFMVIVALEFLLELALIILIYILRIVEDEFQMTKELVFITLCLSSNTIVSIFAHVNRSFLYIYLAVNLCLMVVTSIWPIFSSFTRQGSFQMITQEILSSLQLILQHPVSLDTFEKFLQTEDAEGVKILEIYLSCELFQNNKSREIGVKLMEKINNLDSVIPCFDLKSVDLDDENCFNTVLNHCLIILEDDYYHRFRISPEIEWLKGVIRRQEIFSNRISETSFMRGGNISDMKSSLLSIIKDYSN